MIRITFTDAGDEQLEMRGGFHVARDWFERGLEPPPSVRLVGHVFDDDSGRRQIDALQLSMYDPWPSAGAPNHRCFKLEVDDGEVYSRAAISKLDTEPSRTVPDLLWVELVVERVAPRNEDWRGGSTRVFGGEAPYSILVQVIGTDTRIDMVRPESAMGKPHPEEVLLNREELAELIALLQRAYAKAGGQ